jgi:cytochrome c oxidase subunit IV
MTDHATVHEAGAHGAHPGARQYLAVAAVLLIITVLEVAIFYVPALHPIMVPALLTLSVAKFVLVAMFYMHLKSDSRIYTWLFAAPLLIAIVIIIALMLLFHVI